MVYSHTKLICDPIELFEARLLEMPYKNGKPDFKNIDFSTYWKIHREFIKATRMAKKIVKFNKN
jgi:hypothetical protein